MELKTPIASPFKRLLWTASVLLLGLFSLKSKGNEIVEVRVDPRVEALAIVQFLADRLEAYPSSYQRAVVKHFRPYEDHAAVKLVKEMMNIDSLPKGIHSESCMMALYLKQNGKGLHRMNKEDSSIYSRYYGYERVQKLLKLLPDFMRESDFNRFRQKMKPYYERWEKQMKAFLKGHDWIDPFDKLFGTKSRISVILNPLKKVQSAHASRTRSYIDKDTIRFSYSYREAGPKDSIVFRKDKRKMKELLWHEGTHFVLGNGTFVRFKDSLQLFAHQFDSCRSRIQKRFRYGKWLRYLDEGLAYATTLYLMKKEAPERFAHQKLLMKYNGFAHTEQFLDLLERFEALKQKGTDIPGRFYPLLLEELKEVESGDEQLATDYRALKEKGMKMERKSEQGNEE